ncbi:MAG: cupin domain-containing protein [Pseudomonadota bacterium]
MTADDIIAALHLTPHPEGGHFRETFRDAGASDRAHSTAIYYLLKAGERSHWHRVDAAEVWHWYAGAPLELSQSDGGAPALAQILGTDIASGARPQIVVPANTWQSARSLGDWTLVGCTVAPGFEFSGFEMAPPDWSPGNT